MQQRAPVGDDSADADIGDAVDEDEVAVVEQRLHADAVDRRVRRAAAELHRREHEPDRGGGRERAEHAEPPLGLRRHCAATTVSWVTVSTVACGDVVPQLTDPATFEHAYHAPAGLRRTLTTPFVGE